MNQNVEQEVILNRRPKQSFYCPLAISIRELQR